MAVDVLEIGSPNLGYSPVSRFAKLAAETLEGQWFSINPKRKGRLKRLYQAFSPREKTNGTSGDSLLVIARTPSHAEAAAIPSGLMRKYRTSAIWIVDAFDHENIPPAWRFGSYDIVAVTRPNDVDIYQKHLGDRIMLLPWGTDALGLGSQKAERKIDVLRVGRQPPEWDNDDLSLIACKKNNLNFSGRPRSFDDPLVSHASLLKYMSDARYIIANSNLAAPAKYTHPTQAYITARWTDALAAGCVVAGIPPWEDESMEVLWPESLHSFDKIDLETNIASIKNANKSWSPAIPMRNHREALARLDWRWRISDLAKYLGAVSDSLEAEIVSLRTRITEMDKEMEITCIR